MKYLAACTALIGWVMLANPAFAGDTRIIIKADLGLFGNVGHHYDHRYGHRYAGHFDRRYDRYSSRFFDHRYDRRRDHRTVIIHRAPRVIYAPFGGPRHGYWHDNGRRFDKHWKGSDRRHDNRRYRDRHDRRDRWR